MDKFCEAVAEGFLSALELTLVLLGLALFVLIHTWPFLLLIFGGRYMGWW